MSKLRVSAQRHALPARNLVNKLAGAFHKPIPQATAVATGTNDSNWEEF